MSKLFENMALQICDCGAPKPHAYFYKDPKMGEGARFPYPFGSVEGVEKFIDAHITAKLVSIEQKEAMMKVAQEGGLQEKMSEEEASYVVPLAEELVVMSIFMQG